MPVLEAQNLTVAFSTAGGPKPVVRGVDLNLESGVIQALVGESGAGKTAASLALLGLHPVAGTRIGGSIHFRGRDVPPQVEDEWKPLRGKSIAMIFQEPRRYLNPSQRVGAQLRETLRVLRNLRGPGANAEVGRLLDEVELAEAKHVEAAYPHELSGGMCQRVLIAKALAGNPAVLIADEPTSALDAHRRAGIETLLRRLTAERGLAVLFISHDLRSVARVADRVAVLYAGRVVETSDAAGFRDHPGHPYSRLLKVSIPDAVNRGTPLQVIRGSVPSPGELPHGCPFHPRCPYADPACAAQEEPALRPVPGKVGQRAACHRLEDLWQFW